MDFVHNYNEQDSRRPIQVLASLVKQLASQQLELRQKSTTYTKNSRKTRGGWRWAARLVVFLVFDAVDEYDKTTAYSVVSTYGEARVSVCS